MGKSYARGLAGWPLILGLAIAACGNGSDSGLPPPPAAIGTLAYVLTTCHEDSDGAVFKQSLLIRQGENVPVTVMETPSSRRVRASACQRFEVRCGVEIRLCWRLPSTGVSPDGPSVFEVSDDFSAAAENFLPPEQEGFFVVRADGAAAAARPRQSQPSHSPRRRQDGLGFSPSDAPSSSPI
jgi:hypothetical protein